jgi:hypothetical protein
MYTLVSKREYYGIHFEEYQTLEDFKDEVQAFFQFLYNYPRINVTVEILKEFDYQKYVLTRDMGDSKFEGYVITKYLSADDDHEESVSKQVFIPHHHVWYIGAKKGMGYESIHDNDFGDFIAIVPNEDRE